MKCGNCPRNCQNTRFCNEENISVAKIIEDFVWEEPCFGESVVAIFFSGCNLRCVYCQNYEISRGGASSSYSAAEFAELLKRLDRLNKPIELITPTHFGSKIIDALEIYKPKNTLIYNTSSYENEENMEQLLKYVDVFLPDFKYYNDEIALKYSKCQNYLEICKTAIGIMKRKSDVLENEILKQGVLIRHLVLPNLVYDSLKILDYIASTFGNNTFISIMKQYTPTIKVKDFPNLNRPITNLEYSIVSNHAESLGFTNGYYQSGKSISESFIPSFK